MRFWDQKRFLMLWFNEGFWWLFIGCVNIVGNGIEWKK